MTPQEKCKLNTRKRDFQNKEENMQTRAALDNMRTHRQRIHDTEDQDRPTLGDMKRFITEETRT